MCRTRMLAGSVAVGLLVMWSAPVRADGPSEECRDGAAHCREAYDKLDRCERKRASGSAALDGGTASANRKGEACAAERAGADSECKMTNESCVRDGSGRTPPPHKDD